MQPAFAAGSARGSVIHARRHRCARRLSGGHRLFRLRLGRVGDHRDAREPGALGDVGAGVDRLCAVCTLGESAARRLREARRGSRAVEAVLADRVLRVVAVPQALERLHREPAQIDGAARREVVVNGIARAEPAETLARHRRAPRGAVVDVDGDRALVVARARRRGEADAATSGLVPAIEQVLLRQRAERGVDRQRHATRLLRGDETLRSLRLQVRKDRGAEREPGRVVDAHERRRTQALDLADELRREPLHRRRRAALRDRGRDGVGRAERRADRAEIFFAALVVMIGRRLVDPAGARHRRQHHCKNQGRGCPEMSAMIDHEDSYCRPRAVLASRHGRCTHMHFARSCRRSRSRVVQHQVRWNREPARSRERSRPRTNTTYIRPGGHDERAAKFHSGGVNAARRNIQRVCCSDCYRTSPSMSGPLEEAQAHFRALGWTWRSDGRTLCPICNARASTMPPPMDPSLDV